MNDEDFTELIDVFIAETQEFLQSMEADLLAMEGGTVEERLQAVKSLFRSAHSIKGSASMFGFESLAKAAHCLEDCFAILRDRVELSQLESITITALLQGVDRLRVVADLSMQKDKDKSSIVVELEEIDRIKTQLEAKYGKEERKKISSINSSLNIDVIGTIFEQDLPPVFERLEAELSQCTADRLPQTIAAINDIYYQISGLAGMLQMSDLAEIANRLRASIDAPNLTAENLQTAGWIIARNLQEIRTKVLQGKEKTADLPLEKGDERGIEKGEKAEDILKITNYQTPITNSQSTIRVEVERLTELINLVGELVINRTNFEVQEAQLRSETKRIRKSILALHQFGDELREEYDRQSTANVRDRLKIEIDNERSIEIDRERKFDALEMDRYTEFHSKAIEVIEITQAIARSASSIDELAVKFERSTDRLRRITDRLRTRVMQLRVVSFSSAVDRLSRALRELCHVHNKDVNLLLLGRDTKIDESLLDALRDPLLHLLRNAFDHGIESPEIRIAAGKSAIGQIEIEARHQGGQTIITVTDDGRGIDPEAIRSRVVRNNLVTPSQASELSISELYEFLFLPGFSTVDRVSDLSGRGVGLDIVRSNLRQVRGTIKVDSRLGKGTSFILKLPLMLSIADALLVAIDNNLIAVPLDAVEEIIQIQSDRIQMAGDLPMLQWQDEFIRLVRLQDLLRYKNPESEIAHSNESISIVILASSESVLAVAVDRIVGQQEIVVNPLPFPLSKPRGIVGCTILGDGRVVTILDADDLIEQFHTHSSTTISIDSKSSLGLRTDLSLQPQILVVDDSYAIRQLLSQTLTRARYRTIQAKDGQDAISKLEQSKDCDLIIADIEMPRMDGFELLRSLKSHPAFALIPVAMLTSRSGFKYRQMALELGAVEYFTKPYNEGRLLETIAKLIKK